MEVAECEGQAGGRITADGGKITADGGRRRIGSVSEILPVKQTQAKRDNFTQKCLVV